MNRWTFSRSTSNQDLRQRGKVMSWQPASTQDTGILLPGDGLYFYNRLFYFPYRMLQPQQHQPNTWNRESPSGPNLRHQVKCSWLVLEATLTKRGDRPLPVSPLHLWGRGPHDNRQQDKLLTVQDGTQGNPGHSFSFWLPLFGGNAWQGKAKEGTTMSSSGKEESWKKGALRHNSDSERYFFYLSI